MRACDEDVLKLDVSMCNAFRMQELYRKCNLSNDEATMMIIEPATISLQVRIEVPARSQFREEVSFRC